MGELLALRWPDVDFTRRTIQVRENWTQGETTTPKGGTERAVPMGEEVAERLARVGQRDRFMADDDLVFCTPRGEHLGYKSLKERYRAALKAADLREDFRFHNLRHAFGSSVIRHADSREVMEWMGHADLTTTRRYLDFVDREDAAKRVSEAFRLEEPSRRRPLETALAPSLRPVGVLGDPALQVRARESQPAPTNPYMRQTSRADQFVESAAWHPQEAGCFVGVKERFIEKAGIGHLSLLCMSTRALVCIAFLVIGGFCARGCM